MPLDTRTSKRARLPIPPPGQKVSNISKRAENETRTRDPNLGKVMLYQLSYFRICNRCFSIAVAKVGIFLDICKHSEHFFLKKMCIVFLANDKCFDYQLILSR